MGSYQVIEENGDISWYKKGTSILHRDDGPAIVRFDHRAWLKDGHRHRLDGPAVEYFDGSKYWYVNGQSHREDGPCIEYSDGRKPLYAYKDKWIDCQDQETFERLLKLKAFW